MAHNILLTGVSGYLGGTLLNRWRDAKLPPYRSVYAMVRTSEQADRTRQCGMDPLVLDTGDLETVMSTIVDKQISIIFFLINPRNSDTQVVMIRALAEVRKQTGREVHFLQTTGAKLFSSLTGHPTDHPLLDTDPGLYDLQKNSRGPYQPLNMAVEVNNTVIETAEANNVRSYIFAPCIVYGEGEGFGNRTSIQTVAIVQAAKAMRQMYRTRPDNPVWPVCHVYDNTTLYIEILRHILEGKDIGHGKSGYFLASSGLVAWDDIYSAMAKAMAKRNAVNNDTVEDASEDILAEMGKALDCPAAFVSVQLSGRCTLEAAHGKLLGWKPQYPPLHIFEAADAEVALILEDLESKSRG